MIVCSEHFVKRCKERMGLKKKSTNTLLQRVVKYGIRLEDINRNTAFYSYLSNSRYGNNDLIVYNHYVFVICADRSRITGITVLNLPKEFQKKVDKLKKGDNQNEKSKRPKRQIKERQSTSISNSYSR